jgi:phage FluMu gp28-like protein
VGADATSLQTDSAVDPKSRNMKHPRKKPGAGIPTASAGTGGSPPGPLSPTLSKSRYSAKRDAIDQLRAEIEAARASAGKALAGKPVEELEALSRDHKLGTNVNGWKNPFPPDDPRAVLLEYQFAYREDQSRFKIGLMSRQTGKDFSTQSEAVEDCFVRPKTTWVVAAPSERQALNSLDQGKLWATAFDLAIEDYREEREGGSNMVLKAAEIIFKNGSRIRAVPGKPETVRGESANIALTEFDFFENPSATWRAMLPSITNPLRGGLKRVRLISTPNGTGSQMHKLWVTGDGKKMSWSRHLVTIYHAVLMGLPVDIAELREAFGDPDGWAQEFCCQFLDAAAVLLPYELIATCESIEATEVVPPEYWAVGGAFPVDLGIDFGRRHNLTVSWAAESLPGMQVTKEVLCLDNMPTPDQVDILRPRIRRARRVCLDYTGPGIGMGDYLVKEFGVWDPAKMKFGKIELVNISNPVKVEIFSKLRMAYERGAWRIPSSVAIREDLHSLYRVVTQAGNITFRAPNTEDGHADRATAQALCTRAGTFGGVVAFSKATGLNQSIHRPNLFGMGKKRSFA